VQDGDNLSAIAARFRIPGGWQALWAANTDVVANPYQIRKGMVLRLTGIALSPALSARLQALLHPPAPQGTAAPAGSQPSPAPSPSPSPAPPVPVSPGSYQSYALSLFPQYGWDGSEMNCLDPLWNRESGWNPAASNSSGAYGIPQALPGSKMSSAGPDWLTDGDTQIRWGEGYIKSVYGTPCAAWDHELADGWY
jgi:peptidoglycan DL-endopeptidase CwlO